MTFKFLIRHMNGVRLLYLKKEKHEIAVRIILNFYANYNFQSYFFLVEEDRSVI